MDRYKLHRKVWELLCERIENFMHEKHNKHKAILITDDINKQANISLAMKHSYFLEKWTSSGLRLNHILEMPLFVSVGLSEDVQFADLCSYNVYHAFQYNKKVTSTLSNFGPYFITPKTLQSTKRTG